MQGILELTTKLQGDPDNSWVFAKEFFKKYGFDGIACGAVEKSSGSVVGIMLDMPNNWQKSYERENYIVVDPWAEKSVTTEQPFIYSFDERDHCFNGRDKRVEDMLCNMKENSLSNSLLLPAFKLEDHILALNLWSTQPENSFTNDVDHYLKSLTLAGAILRIHLKDIALEGVFGNAAENWIKNPTFRNPIAPREREVLEWLANGLRSDQIAYKMGIALPTVNFHIASARKKLRAKTREEALAISIVRKFIKP